jgi:uncharacterized protein YkwD
VLAFAAHAAGPAPASGDPAAGLVAPASACPAAVAGTARASELLCLVAWARARRGVRPLGPSAALARSALLKARDVRRCRDFSHTACGRAFGSTFRRAGYAPRRHAIGENLAWGVGSTATPRAVLAAWLRSAPHRATLLGPRWRRVGVASVAAPGLFGQPAATVWVLQVGAAR